MMSGSVTLSNLSGDIAINRRTLTVGELGVPQHRHHILVHFVINIVLLLHTFRFLAPSSFSSVDARFFHPRSPLDLPPFLPETLPLIPPPPVRKVGEGGFSFVYLVKEAQGDNATNHMSSYDTGGQVYCLKATSVQTEEQKQVSETETKVS